MAFIRPSRETPTFVFSKKKLESSFHIFCVLSPFYKRKLFEKAETKHLKLVVYSVYGM